MPHVRHIVISVQIGPAPLIKQVMLPAPQEHNRFGIAKLQIARKTRVALSLHNLLVARDIACLFIWQIQKRRWVGADRAPEIHLVWVRNTGPITAHPVCRKRELKVHMRRPTARLGLVSQMRQQRALWDNVPNGEPLAYLGVEMAIKRIKLVAGRSGVFKDDDATIIEVCRSVFHNMHPPREWRINLCLRGSKAVHSYMHCAAVRGLPRPTAKE